MDDLSLLGPLRALAGTWEGEGGLDFAFNHASGQTRETKFRERTVLSPFGPVDNGTQCLYGLDYRMAAWRDDEIDPFHTEVGYWLWDARDGLVMRSFMVPRGTVVLAGGPATADSTEFTMSAACGSEELGILSNPYLAGAARTSHYTVTVTIDGDDSWSYASDTVIEMANLDEPLHHTDSNTLHRVAD